MNKRLAILIAALAMPVAGYAFDLGNINLNRIGNVIKNVQEANREVPEKEEVAIGEQMASTLLGGAPLVNNPALEKYVNDVGRWLALQTERPDLVWHFGVLDTDAVNAFAAPGGYIFITKGLLKRLNNEAELAGVLAHEIAHVLQKHHLKAIQKNASYGAFAEVATMAVEAHGDGDTKSQVLANLVQGTKELYARGLDKDDEYEADRMGIVIAARAGYDPFALPEVIHDLEKLNPKDPGAELLFETHPAPADRIKAIDQAAGDKLDAYGSQPTLAARFLKHKPNGK